MKRIIAGIGDILLTLLLIITFPILLIGFVMKIFNVE